MTGWKLRITGPNLLGFLGRLLGRVFGQIRRQPVAFVALFFALTGSAVAANNYIRTTDPIPSTSDLAGSTYGNPLIAAGKVSNAKLANSSLNVNAGKGLSGGGSVDLGSSTTLAVDKSSIQARVTGSCGVGTAVQSITDAGDVDCGAFAPASLFGSPSTLFAAGTYSDSSCVMGEIKLIAGAHYPLGTVPADGQLLPINQNAALFAVLGTTYGGNGTTNFALPNLQGAEPAGSGGVGVHYVVCTNGIYPG